MLKSDSQIQTVAKSVAICISCIALAACGTTRQAEPQIVTKPVLVATPVACVPTDLPAPTPAPQPSASTDGPQRYADAAAAYGVLKARNDVLEQIVSNCRSAAKGPP